jgi:hypothetical protein
MLKRLFVTGLLAVFNLFVFGQSISWSGAETLDGYNVSQIFSTTDSTLYVVKQDDERPLEIFVDVFSYDLSKKLSKQITFEVDEINQISMFNDQLIVFGVKFLGKEDELFAFHLDTLGEITGSKSLLKCKANGGYHAHFDVEISPKQEFCAIIGSDGYVPDQKEIIHSILFDKEWKEHHHKEVVTSVLSQKRSYNAITVNDEGVTYVMKRERKKSADKYYVFCITESGSEKHHELHLKARHIVDMRFDLDTLGNLYLGGFYAPPYKSYYEGVYVKKINPEGTELFSKEYMFNENVIMAFNSKKEVKEFGYGLRKFRTSHFGFANEKNIILEAEHITKQKNKNGKFKHIQDGFILINLSNKGGFQYAAPVNTLQTDETDNGYWSSHCHVNFEGEDIIYLNILGEGTKGIKEDMPSKAHLYTYKIKMTSNGVPKRELQTFDTDIENHAIYPDFKNHSKLPLLIIKSKDKDQYAIGLLAE